MKKAQTERKLPLASKKKATTAGESSSLSATQETKLAPQTEPVHPRIAFIKSVHLVGVGLDESRSHLDRDALAAALQNDEPLENRIKAHNRIIEHTDSYFIVGADFELIQTSKNGGESLLSITANFSAKFDLAEPAPANLIAAFSKLEARLIFFPYLRHFISDMTYRMSVDPIVLPLTSELES